MNPLKFRLPELLVLQVAGSGNKGIVTSVFNCQLTTGLLFINMVFIKSSTDINTLTTSWGVGISDNKTSEFSESSDSRGISDKGSPRGKKLRE